mgnify:CR=1 FL=1
MDILESVLEIVDEFLSLDFLLKYSIIITNFIVIAGLIWYKRTHKTELPPEEQKTILLVTAHPDDEAM